MVGAAPQKSAVRGDMSTGKLAHLSALQKDQQRRVGEISFLNILGAWRLFLPYATAAELLKATVFCLSEGPVGSSMNIEGEFA